MRMAYQRLVFINKYSNISMKFNHSDILTQKNVAMNI